MQAMPKTYPYIILTNVNAQSFHTICDTHRYHKHYEMQLCVLHLDYSVLPIQPIQ